MSAPFASGRGLFITLEGGEGVGKSTQMRLLAARLEARGLEVVATREPGGSPKAEAIREAILSGRTKFLGPMAEALLFSAARIDHLDSLIRPALARGAWVICDRFSDSTTAYQGATGEPEPAVLRALERVVVGGDRPDLTLILDLPPEVGLARADVRRRQRGEVTDRFEGEAPAFHRDLRARFLAIAAAEPDRCVVIDADAPVETVGDRIWKAVDERLLSPAKDGTSASTDEDAAAESDE
ncbi:dTMP kinase [Pseudochelatococcus lubricantis]|uniref:Thymidylate kinase n=1 Tax=Pseudochelatococcus lubricantis TaxID=1538102 RepID=A0ABX0UWU1_9HYPH|nr:dTMP kinase [Pseudochelatococcus lubricantis]